MHGAIRRSDWKILIVYLSNQFNFSLMKSFRVGHIYKDRGAISKDGDEFLAWVNIPGSGMLNSTGTKGTLISPETRSCRLYMIINLTATRNSFLQSSISQSPNEAKSDLMVFAF